MVHDDALIETLRVAVPLWIEKVRGWSETERIRRAVICAQYIGSHGDALQFRSKNTARSTAGQAFNRFAEGLAIAAFAPGGVTYGDQHWEAAP
jgi:hypothetical protein